MTTESLRQSKARPASAVVELFNRASPSIVAAGVIAMAGLLFNVNTQVTAINGTLRSLQEQFTRISTRVDTLEASVQSAELDIREMQAVIKGAAR